MFCSRRKELRDSCSFDLSTLPRAVCSKRWGATLPLGVAIRGVEADWENEHGSRVLLRRVIVCKSRDSAVRLPVRGAGLTPDYAALHTGLMSFARSGRAGWRGFHSQRMAEMGLMRAERRAGKSDAALAIKARARMEPAKTQGSCAVMP